MITFNRKGNSSCRTLLCCRYHVGQCIKDILTEAELGKVSVSYRFVQGFFFHQYRKTITNAWSNMQRQSTRQRQRQTKITKHNGPCEPTSQSHSQSRVAKERPGHRRNASRFGPQAYSKAQAFSGVCLRLASRCQCWISTRSLQPPTRSVMLN